MVTVREKDDTQERPLPVVLKIKLIRVLGVNIADEQSAEMVDGCYR